MADIHIYITKDKIVYFANKTPSSVDSGLSSDPLSLTVFQKKKKWMFDEVQLNVLKLGDSNG